MRYAFCLVCGVLIAASVVPGSLQAQDRVKPTIVGTWNFNAEKSDDVQQKIRQALRGGGPPRGGDDMGGTGGMGRTGRTAGRTGGRAGGSRGGMGGGGAEGVIEGGGGRGDRGGPGMREMGTLLKGPAKLSIERTDSTVTLQRDDLDALVLFTDGRQVDLGSADTESRFTEKAQWKGDRLVVHTIVGENLEMEETYEIRGGDSPILQVEAKLENRQMGRTIKLKRIYDAAAAG